MSKVIASGNEAVARGVWEAGGLVAAAYPGTPSTEILENIAEHYKQDVYCQWACNEKVAFEIAVGASIGGARSFCAFKHVGMNVATDPIFTMGYAGVTGGLVFVSADDPGCHSSQNEQDNRHYAPHAKIAMLEPADSQECKDYTVAAYELAEQFDTPVMLRMTTRICHSKGVVEFGERKEKGVVPYERNPGKFAMLPGTARARHIVREQKLLELEDYAYDCAFNRVEKAAGSKIGIITSGVCYQHAREVFGDSASYLKFGLTYPLSRKLIREFCKDYETLYVIEENDPYLENAIRAEGFLNVIGKEKITIQGELNARIIRDALLDGEGEALYKSEMDAPPRPPVLCAGCPHRGFFYALKKYQTKIVSVSDIGCYALGLNPPLNGFDYSICMGAGFSSIIGLAKALEMAGDGRKALGSLGDSTFFHSGITGLVDIVAADANVIAVVLDNSITAMTGHQENPGTMQNLMGEETKPIDILAIIRATGLDESRIRVVDPLDVPAVQAALADGIAIKGPFVIVTKRPCVLIKAVQRQNAGKFCRIDPDKCTGCKSCMKIACPAIAFADGKATIFDPASCTACGLCVSMCKFGAIERQGD